MTSRRAFTLVELMLVSAMTAVIVGALGALFVFVATRASQTMSKNGVLLQAQALSEELDNTISQAQSCKLVNLRGGITGLKCVMPASGTDVDGDGIRDKYDPLGVRPNGREGYGAGKRMWYFMSDSSGATSAVMAHDGIFWRSWRDDDSIPSVGDLDRKFAYYYGTTNPKWNFIDTVSFTVNGDGTLTFTLSANKLRRSERRSESGDSEADLTRFQMKRTVLLDSWRK